eukprot:COSAG02_NODE_10027_length_2044_cov_50.503033_4_plen_128_part_00
MPDGCLMPCLEEEVEKEEQEEDKKEDYAEGKEEREGEGEEQQQQQEEHEEEEEQEEELRVPDGRLRVGLEVVRHEPQHQARLPHPRLPKQHQLHLPHVPPDRGHTDNNLAKRTVYGGVCALPIPSNW